MDQGKKQPAPPPDSAWQDEGLEFELTDIEDARRTLDMESMSQFDVATVMAPDHWKRLRRARLPTDRALSGHAIDWLISLPASLRPERLSKEFPRIVNDLAQVWDEPELCEAAFDKLLHSGRKNRQGFPPAVLEELLALHDWTQLF